MGKTRYRKLPVLFAAVSVALAMTVGMTVSAEEGEVRKSLAGQGTEENICSVGGIGYTSLQEAF